MIKPWILVLAVLLAVVALPGCEEATTPQANDTPTPDVAPVEPAPAIEPAPEPAGPIAPALTFDRVYNAEEETTFESLRGSDKAILLDFFAVWCPPCIEALPHLAKVDKQYGDRLQVVSVTDLQGMMMNHGKPRVDYISPAKEYELMNTFIAYNKITWPVVFVPNGEILELYGVSRIPTLVLIDADGVVRYRGSPLGLDPALVKLFGE